MTIGEEYKPLPKEERLARRIEAQLAAGVRHIVFVGAELDWIRDALRCGVRSFNTGVQAAWEVANAMVQTLPAEPITPGAKVMRDAALDISDNILDLKKRVDAPVGEDWATGGQMTPEEFYDAEIAPTLMALARKCEDRGFSIVAKVEWEPGETGLTASVREKAGFGLRLTHWAAASNGNVDSLVIACKKYGQEHGHESICLHLLGVPFETRRPAT